MHDAGDDRLARDTTILGLRQEHDAAGVMAFCWQIDIIFSCLLTHECIRHLNQDTCAITQFWVIAGCAAVCQVGENLQALTHNVVALFTFDICNEANTASVMFMTWVV